MANTKTTSTYEERIAKEDLKIEQSLNRRKKLVQKQKADERKQRNSRLCRRHGLLEKLMPEIITITDDQFEAFIRTGINTTYGRKRIGEILEKGAEAATAYVVKCRAEDKAKAEAEQRQTQQQQDNGSNESPQQSQQHNDNGSSAKPPQGSQSGA